VDVLRRRCNSASSPDYAISGEAREAGFPARPSSPLDETVREIAAQHGASPAQIRLAWTLLHQGPNVLAIPGTGSLAHLEENLAAGQIELGAPQSAALEDAGRRRQQAAVAAG
jgi:pyridoxine 4-dehydrogenase